jgi:twitching motility protein PilT
MFTKDEEQQVRERLAGTLRYIVSQRLVPKTGGGRLLVTELLGSNMRSREVIAMGESETRRLNEIIEAASVAGWHTFEQSLLAAFQNGQISEETALLYCTNKSTMLLRIDRAKKDMETSHVPHSLKMRAEEKEEKPVEIKPPPLAAEPAAK